jgi:hypothetical protein
MPKPNVFLKDRTREDVIGLSLLLGLTDKNILPATVPEMTHLRSKTVTVTVTTLKNGLFDMEVTHNKVMDEPTEKLAGLIAAKRKGRKK